MSSGITLYRHYDKDESLLYVGISEVMPDSNASRKPSQKLFSGTSRIDLKAYPSSLLALEARAEIISSENPRHNVIPLAPKASTRKLPSSKVMENIARDVFERQQLLCDIRETNLRIRTILKTGRFNPYPSETSRWDDLSETEKTTLIKKLKDKGTTDTVAGAMQESRAAQTEVSEAQAEYDALKQILGDVNYILLRQQDFVEDLTILSAIGVRPSLSLHSVRHVLEMMLSGQPSFMASVVDEMNRVSRLREAKEHEFLTSRKRCKFAVTRSFARRLVHRKYTKTKRNLPPHIQEAADTFDLVLVPGET